MPRTWDHVFPESWYPDTTPSDIAKWKIPACHQCNKEYGELEQDLMIRIGLCIDPEAVESEGIVPKVLRSLNPNLAKNERDRKARQAKVAQIMRETIAGAAIPKSATYPRFEEKWGRPPDEQVAVPIPKKSVDRLFEKIIRGFAFIDGGRFIEESHSIALFPLHAANAAPFRQLLDKFGQAHARGPGIVVRKAVAPEDGLSAVYKIIIWGLFQTYGVVSASET